MHKVTRNNKRRWGYWLFALSILLGAWLTKSHYDVARLPPAVACSLPADTTLLISCTDNCGYFTRRALARAAEDLGYAIDIIPDLSTQSPATLARLDALIIPGGADIDPRYYNTPRLPQDMQARIRELDEHVQYTREGARRDAYEFGLLQRYFADQSLAHLPILGICRGMQMLSVSQGIPLHVDINTELGTRIPKYHLDRVTTGPETGVLQHLLPGQHFFASQFHHQAMRYDYFLAQRERYPHLRVTALSHQSRIAEVLEFTERPIIGTQFHPEYTVGAINKRLFEWLLGSACRKRQADNDELDVKSTDANDHPEVPGRRSAAPHPGT